MLTPIRSSYYDVELCLAIKGPGVKVALKLAF